MLTLADFPDTQPDTIPGLTYSPQWHHEQEAEERAWLDQWTRAEQTPQYPWARPDWDVMGDWTTFLTAQRTKAGSL